MEMESQLKIGEAAQRAGLSVRTVPWYSDQGLVPSVRSPAGCGLYRIEAVAGLETDPDSPICRP
jgi:MerR family regulatory protein